MNLAAWQMWWKRRGARGLQRILVEEWDPIGVRGSAEAQDEYDSYLNPLVRRLRAGASTEDVAAYLTRIEEEFMGLAGSPLTRERTQRSAVRLVSWYAEEMAVEER